MSMPDDVTPQQWERQAQLWRALGPKKQAELAASMWRAGREAALVAVRRRHPDASEAFIDWTWRAMFVGEAAARRMYGPKPEQ